jgi:hypothetical protein
VHLKSDRDGQFSRRWSHKNRLARKAAPISLDWSHPVQLSQEMGLLPQVTGNRESRFSRAFGPLGVRCLRLGNAALSIDKVPGAAAKGSAKQIGLFLLEKTGSIGLLVLQPEYCVPGLLRASVVNTACWVLASCQTPS